MIQEIDDHRDVLPMSHKIDHRVTRLPNSLREAVRTFLLAKAIRMVRGQRKVHNSMLVNVSRFTSIQRQIRNEIHAFVDGVAASIRVNGARPEHEAVRDPKIRALRRTFEEQYADSASVRWDQVQRHLAEAVGATRVAEINSKSSDSLMYSEYPDSGWTVIAVGGFSLSRGLTLEGLSVSYMLRRSMMYDTLFQMGRWFGYRDDYDDLCRVWMPDEARGWYEHIAESIEELRKELVQMEIARATPQEFGLKVRSHPDSLMVTARNKMGTGFTHRVRDWSREQICRDNGAVQRSIVSGGEPESGQGTGDGQELLWWRTRKRPRCARGTLGAQRTRGNSRRVPGDVQEPSEIAVDADGSCAETHSESCHRTCDVGRAVRGRHEADARVAGISTPWSRSDLPAKAPGIWKRQSCRQLCPET